MKVSKTRKRTQTVPSILATSAAVAATSLALSTEEVGASPVLTSSVSGTTPLAVKNAKAPSSTLMSLPAGYQFSSKRDADGFPKVVPVRATLGGRNGGLSSRVNELNQKVREHRVLQGKPHGALNDFGGALGSGGDVAATDLDCTSTACTT